MSVPSLARFKRCTKCGCTKPATTDFFHRLKRGKWGFAPVCKVCRSAHARTYYEDNRAKFAAYRLSRREESIAHLRLYRIENKERLAVASRARRLANPEQERARDRRKRVRKSQAEHEPYTSADLNAMWHEQGGLCAYCGTPLFGDYHADHVMPLSRGGADKLSNIVLACPTCNLRKYTRTGEEFMRLLGMVTP